MGEEPPRRNLWDVQNGTDAPDPGLSIGDTGSDYDNSPEIVLWECAVVIAVSLACALLVQIALRLAGV